MARRIIVALLVVVLCLSAVGHVGVALAESPPSIDWVKQFGSVVLANELAQAVDAEGNVYMAGYTGGTLPGQTNAGYDDAFVRKYDASGNEVWTRQFGTVYSDYASGISVDSSGVYVAGYTQDTLPGQTSAGLIDAFVRKYNASGNEVWTRQFGTAKSDYARGISVDSSGVYVAGDTYGTFPGQTSAGWRDAFIRKYDANGSNIWTRQFGSGTDDWTSGISVDSSEVYVAGYTYGTLPGQTSAGYGDAFVRKYDTGGSEVWTRQFGTAAYDWAWAISVDSSGVYVAGSTPSTLPGQTSAGLSDAYVRKYDTGGSEVWTRQFGTADWDYAYGISVDSSGVYVAGDTTGTFPGQTNAGDIDVYVRKYDSGGSDAWTRQFGTAAQDWARGISVDSSGVYVVGQTRGAFPGQTNVGAQDAFIAKLTLIIAATIDINPDTLNLNSGGKWVTAYIELSEGYGVADIDATTVLLNDAVPAVTDPKYDFVTDPNKYITDNDDDGILERMVKFDQSAVQDILAVGDEVEITVTGEVGELSFEGSDMIRVIVEGPPEPIAFVNGFLLTQAIDGTLYAYDNGLGELLKSTDGGSSWSNLTEYGGGDVVDIATSSADADVVYVADASAVYKTEDGGDSWHGVSPDTMPDIFDGAPDNENITSLAVGYWNNEPIVYFGTEDPDATGGGVYFLNEEVWGAAWTDLNIGTYDVHGLGTSPDFDNDTLVVAVAANTNETFVLTNRGGAGGIWDAVELESDFGDPLGDVDNDFAITEASDPAFVEDFDEDDAFEYFVGVIGPAHVGGDGGVYRIFGESAGDFDLLDDVDADIMSLDILGDQGNTSLMAGTSGGSVHYSTNDGDSWTEAERPPTGNGNTYVVLASDFTTSGEAWALVSGTDGGLSLTTDGGATWNLI